MIPGLNKEQHQKLEVYLRVYGVCILTSDFKYLHPDKGEFKDDTFYSSEVRKSFKKGEYSVIRLSYSKTTSLPEIQTKQKVKLTDYLKQSQYVETTKGWTKGFVFVYLDKKTYRIKHTFNQTRGSRLYVKSYKETIKHFEKI